MAVKTRHRCLICGAVKPSKFGDCSEEPTHNYATQLSTTIASETHLQFTMPDFRVGHAVGKKKCAICGDAKPCRYIHSNQLYSDGIERSQRIPISNVDTKETHVPVCGACYGSYKVELLKHGWSLCSCEKLGNI